MAAIEEVTPHVVCELRDLVFEDVDSAYFPDFSSMAELFEGVFALEPQPLDDLARSEWEERHHLHQWRSKYAAGSFQGIVAIVERLWRENGVMPTPLVAEMETGRPIYSRQSLQELAELAYRSRIEGRWAELIMHTIGNPLVANAIYMNVIGDDEQAPEDVRHFASAVRLAPPPYNPLLTTRSAWLKQAEEYCDRVDSAATLLRLREPKEKRQPEHFAWLARFQVGGEDFWQLANRVDEELPEPGADTEGRIRKAVNRLAGEVGIKLRRSRRRRRRK